MQGPARTEIQPRVTSQEERHRVARTLAMSLIYGSRQIPAIFNTATRQNIVSDCSICCEHMGSGGRLLCCKVQCGQNFHEECVNKELGLLEGQGRARTCPYW